MTDHSLTCFSKGQGKSGIRFPKKDGAKQDSEEKAPTPIEMFNRYLSQMMFG